MSAYGFTRGVAKFYCCFLNRLEIIGSENIPESGPFILFAPHYSQYDIMVIMAAMSRRVFFLAKNSLFKIPLVRHFIKGCGCIPVNRDGKDAGSIMQSVEVLNEGNVLGIFPEGTRVRGKKVSNPKGGIVKIAQIADTLMLPFDIIYGRKWLFFTKITVNIGKPISLSEYDEDLKSSESCRKVACDLMKRLKDHQ